MERDEAGGIYKERTKENQGMGDREQIDTKYDMRR